MHSEELKSETETYLNQAKTFHHLGQTAQAVAAFQAADRLFSEQGDERGRTRCWSGIAKAYGKNKQYELSLEAFGEAARHAARAGWYDKEIEALYNQGLTLQQLGVRGANLRQVGQAIEAFRQALEVAREINDRASVGVLLISLGFACDWSKRDEEAIAYFSEAAPFALDTADFDTAFSAFSSLGVLLSNHNRAAEAIPYYLRALELAKSEQGDLVAVADTFANLGIAYEKAGQLPEAIEALENYREILHYAGDVKAADAAAMLKRLKNKARLLERQGI
jgi:tetratricopeptide (TPR) repeat protein